MTFTQTFKFFHLKNDDLLSHPSADWVENYHFFVCEWKIRIWFHKWMATEHHEMEHSVKCTRRFDQQTVVTWARIACCRNKFKLIECKCSFFMNVWRIRGVWLVHKIKMCGGTEEKWRKNKSVGVFSSSILLFSLVVCFPLLSVRLIVGSAKFTMAATRSATTMPQQNEENVME